MITLTYNGTTASLAQNLMWIDEFDWSPIQQSTSYSTTGALLVDVGTRQAGRPITLQGTDTAAWIPRSLCETLQAWAAIAGAQFTLTLRDTPRTVLFDHDKGGFSAQPVWQLADGEQHADDLFLPTLRFMEI